MRTTSHPALSLPLSLLRTVAFLPTARFSRRFCLRRGVTEYLPSIGREQQDNFNLSPIGFPESLFSCALSQPAASTRHFMLGID